MRIVRAYHFHISHVNLHCIALCHHTSLYHTSRLNHGQPPCTPEICLLILLSTCAYTGVAIRQNGKLDLTSSIVAHNSVGLFNSSLANFDILDPATSIAKCGGGIFANASLVHIQGS